MAKSSYNSIALLGFTTLAAGISLLIYDLTPVSAPSEPAPFTSEARVVYDRYEFSSLGSQALDKIDYDWESKLPGWQIHFIPGEGSAAGYTWSQERLIEIFVRDSSTPSSLARVIAHELGHATDLTLNTPDERQFWLDARSAEEAEWWPDSGASDFNSGAGDFAEVFAFWLVNDIDFKSKVGPVPSPRDLKLVSEMANG